MFLFKKKSNYDSQIAESNQLHARLEKLMREKEEKMPEFERLQGECEYLSNMVNTTAVMARDERQPGHVLTVIGERNAKFVSELDAKYRERNEALAVELDIRSVKEQIRAVNEAFVSGVNQWLRRLMTEAEPEIAEYLRSANEKIGAMLDGQLRDIIAEVGAIAKKLVDSEAAFPYLSLDQYIGKAPKTIPSSIPDGSHLQEENNKILGSWRDFPEGSGVKPFEPR